jgi:hypothetical protein
MGFTSFNPSYELKAIFEIVIPGQPVRAEPGIHHHGTLGLANAVRNDVQLW